MSSLLRCNQTKNILEETVEKGHLADFLCIYGLHELACGLVSGGPHKHDLTKLASDEYSLPRLLKDMLDAMLERFRIAGKDSSMLYTIGIQVR